VSLVTALDFNFNERALSYQDNKFDYEKSIRKFSRGLFGVSELFYFLHTLKTKQIHTKLITTCSLELCINWIIDLIVMTFISRGQRKIILKELDASF